MRYKKSLLVICLFVCLFGIASVCAGEVSENATVTDDNLAVGDDVQVIEQAEDNEIIDTMDAGTFTALQNRIDNAASGAKIALENDYAYDNGFSTSGIRIEKGITIEGNGHTIDAKGLSRAFYIRSDNVTLKNLYIKNTYFYSDDFESSWVVDNTWSWGGDWGYYDCTYTARGGAIYSRGDNFVLENCIFDKNNIILEIPGGQPEGISNYKKYGLLAGGMVYCRGDNIAIRDCRFANSEYNVINDYNHICNVYGEMVYSNGRSVVNCDFYMSGKEPGDLVFADDITSLNNFYSSYSGNYPISFKKTVNVVSGVDIKTSDVTGYYGTTQKVVTRLSRDNSALANVNVRITVNGKTSTVKTDSRGQASVELNLPVGTHEVTTEYDGSSVKSKVTVKSTITVNDASGVYSNSKVSATFLNTDGKPLVNKKVTFNVNGKDYSETTDNNGIATAKIVLGVGTHTVTATNPINNEQKQFKLTVSKAKAAIELSVNQNVNGVTLTAIITPSGATGEVRLGVIPIKQYDNGVEEWFIEESRSYDGIKVNNGKATVTVPDLDAGSYMTYAIYNGDNNVEYCETDFVKFNVADVYIILDANDVTKNYGDDNNLVVNLGDSKGNKITNADILVIINGMYTPLKTDAYGRAVMPINQDCGIYTATVTYGDMQTTAKITVIKAIPKISAKKATFKAKAKTKKYAIKLYANGKPVNKAKVTLNVNGKKYSAKTKSNGKATFKITKLTKKGKYVASIAFNGNNNYDAANKRIKITLK